MIRRTSVRLNTHRSATAWGAALQDCTPCARPAPPVLLPGFSFTASVYRSDSISVHRAASLAFPVVIRLAQRKPPFGGDTKEVQLGTFPGSYFRLVHSAPAPAHTPASRTTSDSLCGSSPCGVYSVVFNARCGFALPGTFCRDNAQSATFFRLNDRKQATSLKCRHAVRGSRVYD